MAKTDLTPLQLSVMRSLWKRKEASVTDVHADLAGNHNLAPTTVATLLRRLEERGLVDHRAEGRQYIFRALVEEERATRSMVTELSERLFGGDVPRLVSHLLKEHELSPGDLDRIRDMIADHEAQKEELS